MLILPFIKQQLNILLLVVSMTTTGSLCLRAAAETPSDEAILKSLGFTLRLKTQINGAFTGCEKGQRYNLKNGDTFICEPIEKQNRTEFLIFTNSQTHEERFLINGIEYDGELE